jgi:membrane-associated PAP2 superfamily phosphatase
MPGRLIPLLVLVIATLALRFSPVDVAVARRVFDPSLPQPWKWAWQTPWSLLYQYGVWPAWLLAAIGGVCLAAAAVRKRSGRLGRSGLFLVLVTALGPGVLVNLVFKPWYARPRPRDLAEFGGQHGFVPVLTHRPSENCSSFPSGHAAMAFCLFTPAFLFADRSRTAAIASAAIGLLLGGAVGTARILQGAHFISDIVWSAGIVYITALVLSRVLRLDDP